MPRILYAMAIIALAAPAYAQVYVPPVNPNFTVPSGNGTYVPAPQTYPVPYAVPIYTPPPVQQTFPHNYPFNMPPNAFGSTIR